MLKPTPLCIEVEVVYDKGIVPRRIIEINPKLEERNIHPRHLIIPYSAVHQNNLAVVSGGLLSPLAEPVIMRDGTHVDVPVSFNIRARFDEPEGLWNIDIYVDQHTDCLSKIEKRLITHHEHRVHKEKLNNIGASSSIKINWWIDGVEMTPINASR